MRPADSPARPSTATSAPRTPCSPRCWSASATSCSPSAASACATPRRPTEALEALIDWHVTFALEHKALIVVQDRDWAALPLEAREKVRETQRKYVEVWVKQLRALDGALTPKEARASVHATFGLLNSTPHSAFLDPDDMRGLLCGMAAKALIPA